MQLLQSNAITMCRAEVDDAVDGKVIFNFSPLLGNQDGVNTLFQIPAQRVVVGSNFTIYKNQVALVLGVDYNVLNYKTGAIQFTSAPTIQDSLSTTFPYTWMDDIEFDHHLNRAASELGYIPYYTGNNTVSGTEQPLDENGNPIVLTDWPHRLLAALIYLGGYHAASAISSRFAQKYDISAGDKSYSPSQMAEAYEKLAARLQKQGLVARDDFYKGNPQGSQYRPSIATMGYILPNVTPPR